MTITDVINRTNRVPDATFAAMLPALQAQADEDLGSTWGIVPSRLRMVGRAESPDLTVPAQRRILLLNTSDTPGDLGYHEDDSGFPEARIFCEDDLRYGALLSVTISHELIEMEVDPLTTRMGPLIDGSQFIIEPCDAVEADEDGYVKPAFPGVQLSNFCLPAYYQPGSAPPWDWCRRLPGPCPAVLPGGYLMYLHGNVWTTTAARYADGRLSHRAYKPLGRSWRRAARGAP